MFSSLNKLDIYENMEEVDLYEIEKSNWKNNILTMPKLRTYCTFKENYETEPFVYKVHNRAHISLLYQFRCGFLLLKIETNQYTQIPLEFRLCILCDSNLVDFLFQCQFYHTLKAHFLSKS